jgi:hypothetical protein
VDVVPSPKVHTHDVGELVDESAKVTVSGATPEVGVPVKLAAGATGAAVTVMYPAFVSVLLPPAFVAFNETV